ncbi:MAG: PIG-L family deacetylase [Kangiellaceae bacterium]|nr:PIG-L family deacetylase [Kangiellaceae bacterium]
MKKILKTLLDNLLLWFLQIKSRSFVKPIIPLKKILAGTKVVILIPHSDDEVLGCYNFIKENGLRLEIELILVTRTANPEINAKRVIESKRALTGLPFKKLYFWELEEGRLEENKEKLRSNLKSIDGLYDYVFTLAPNDTTNDHSYISDSTSKNIKKSKVVYYRSTSITFNIMDASFYCKGTFLDKKNALRHYKTQDSINLINTIKYNRNEALILGYSKKYAIEAFIFAEDFNENQKAINSLSTGSLIRELFR